MIVLARLEAENVTMQALLADLDKAEEAINGVLEFGTTISDEHYERMTGGQTSPPYFKGRRVFKLARPVVSETDTHQATRWYSQSVDNATAAQPARS